MKIGMLRLILGECGRRLAGRRCMYCTKFSKLHLAVDFCFSVLISVYLIFHISLSFGDRHCIVFVVSLDHARNLWSPLLQKGQTLIICSYRLAYFIDQYNCILPQVQNLGWCEIDHFSFKCFFEILNIQCGTCMCTLAILDVKHTSTLFWKCSAVYILMFLII